MALHEGVWRTRAPPATGRRALRARYQPFSARTEYASARRTQSAAYVRIPAALTPQFRKVLTPQFRSIDPTPVENIPEY